MIQAGMIAVLQTEYSSMIQAKWPPVTYYKIPDRGASLR